MHYMKERVSPSAVEDQVVFDPILPGCGVDPPFGRFQYPSIRSCFNVPHYCSSVDPLPTTSLQSLFYCLYLTAYDCSTIDAE